MSIDETRLIEILGDFEKKIRLQISDMQMSVDNSMTIFDYRIKSIEAILKRYKQTQFSNDYNDFTIRFEEIEKRIQALEGREQTQ